MDVLGEVVAGDRRTGTTALDVPSVGRRYDYRRFCTSAWKVGNLLRHLGVRGGAGVAVADDPFPEPLLAFYGAALLGGVVRFGPTPDVGDDVRALVVPAVELDAFDAGPSTKRLAYGDAPDDPSVSYFERDVWSENPTEPPERVAPDDPLLWTGASTYTHGEVLESAGAAVAALGIEPGVTVAVDGSFADPGVVVAGLVAPLIAGATVSVGPDCSGDVVVDAETGALPEWFGPGR
jgi:hypothetical protein